jgi:hypothetical protein
LEADRRSSTAVPPPASTTATATATATAVTARRGQLLRIKLDILATNPLQAVQALAKQGRFVMLPLRVCHGRTGDDGLYALQKNRSFFYAHGK